MLSSAIGASGYGDDDINSTVNLVVDANSYYSVFFTISVSILKKKFHAAIL